MSVGGQYVRTHHITFVYNEGHVFVSTSILGTQSGVECVIRSRGYVQLVAKGPPGCALEVFPGQKHGFAVRASPDDKVRSPLS